MNIPTIRVENAPMAILSKRLNSDAFTTPFMIPPKIITAIIMAIFDGRVFR
jgi:hypothetical protein